MSSEQAYERLDGDESHPQSPLPPYDAPSNDEKGAMPSMNGDLRPIIIIQEQSPPAKWLFLLGFVFTPAWLVGSVMPAETRSEQVWRRVNRSLVGIHIVLAALFLLAIASSPDAFNQHRSIVTYDSYYEDGRYPADMETMPMIIDDVPQTDGETSGHKPQQFEMHNQMAAPQSI